MDKSVGRRYYLATLTEGRWQGLAAVGQAVIAVDDSLSAGCVKEMGLWFNVAMC